MKTCAVLGSLFTALVLCTACGPSNPGAPRQEVQSTWPDGRPKIVLGLRADTVYERLEYHQTGQLKSRGQLVNGARHGIWNSYYDTGMPWSQVTYDRGEEHGPYRTYHPNGEPAIEGAFDHGTRIGTWSFFGEEGQRLKDENF
jgi:hypothetical protein